MARGFGSTLGISTTDSLVTGFTKAISGKRSYFAWIWENGLGGGSSGRWFTVAGTEDELSTINAGPIWVYQIAYTTTNGKWTIVWPGANAWHSLLITYDVGSPTTPPIFYLDGLSAAVTTVTSPVGTQVVAGTNYIIGNRTSDNARVWDGKLAWHTIWDGVILDASEAYAIGAMGVQPNLIRPSTIACCYPLSGYSPAQMDLIVRNRYGAMTGSRAAADPPLIRQPLQAAMKFFAMMAGTVAAAPLVYQPKRIFLKR